MINVTCAADMLHKLSNNILDESKLVDSFIAKINKLFTKSRDQIDLFREIALELLLLPQPVAT